MELIIDYIPYSKDAEVKNPATLIKALKTIYFLLEQSIYAISSYESNLYHLFDPQVSENLCQIRAFQNYIIFKSGKIENKKDLIISYMKRIEVIHNEFLLNQSSQNSNSNKHETMHNYLKERLSDIKFDQLWAHITLSFVLTKYSLIGENGISIGINYKSLSADLGIKSITYASKVVHQLQRTLSYRSSEFIFKLMKQNNCNDNFCKMMKLFYQKDEILRHVLPCYYVTNIILEHISKYYSELTIIIHVKFRDETSLLFPFRLNEKGAYHHTVPVEKYKHDPCLIFEGIVDDNINKVQWMSDFFKADLVEIIRMNMAAHPQYSGKKLSHLKNNPFVISKSILKGYGLKTDEDGYFLEEKHFIKDQVNAEHHGCSINNASLFLIKHIFCASPLQLINMHKLESHKPFITKAEPSAIPYEVV